MSGEIDEDSITIESLQAQIDLSMSFAQSLVSSWVKPNKPGSSNINKLENEVLETMRRRPRLGVGADSAEALSTARDTARLKGQLIGKKRPREQDQAEAAERTDQAECEEESRAGAIKKKVKVDPFAESHKKNVSTVPTVTTAGLTPSKEVEGGVSNPVTPHHMDSAQGGPQSTAQDTSPKKKKKKNKRLGSPLPASTNSTPLILETLPAPAAGIDGTFSTKPSALQSKSDGVPFDQLSILSSTSSSITNNDPCTTRDGFKISTSMLKGRDVPSPAKLPAELLNKPILNLQEISSDGDSEDGLNQKPQTSPKKKRKRRKKKKKTTSADATLTETAQPPTIKLLIS